MVQDGDCVKVQSQTSGALPFKGNGLISRPPRNLTAAAKSISQKAKDLGYWLAFG
jgi:hypothetical protein